MGLGGALGVTNPLCLPIIGGMSDDVVTPKRNVRINTRVWAAFRSMCARFADGAERSDARLGGRPSANSRLIELIAADVLAHGNDAEIAELRAGLAETEAARSRSIRSRQT